MFTKSIFSALNSATEFQIGTAKARIMQREPIVIVTDALGKRKLRRQVFTVYSLSKIRTSSHFYKVCRSLMTLFYWWSGSNAVHVGRRLLFYMCSVGIWFFTQEVENMSKMSVPHFVAVKHPHFPYSLQFNNKDNWERSRE